MSGWNFDKVDKISTSSLDAKVIDGHLWLTTGTTVQVWNIWGDVDLKDLDRDVYYDLIAGEFRAPVKVIEFTVENGAGRLADAGDMVWISNLYPFNSFISVKKDFSDLESGILKSGSRVVKAPETMASDFLYAYGKLWMVSYAEPTNTTNTMYSYDGTWTSSLIPNKGQLVTTRLCDGLNGFVYATRFNNLGIAKFASSTGQYVTTIPVNGETTALTTDGLGSILVGSFSGMVSAVNDATDVVTDLYSTISVAGNLHDTNDGYLWAVSEDGKGFIRITKSDLSVRHTDEGFDAPPGIDYKFETDKFLSYTRFDAILATRDEDFYYWNGSSMVKTTAHKRLILVGPTAVFVVKLKDALYQAPSAEVMAYGFITTGQYDYAGD